MDRLQWAVCIFRVDVAMKGLILWKLMVVLEEEAGAEVPVVDLDLHEANP